MSTLNMLRNVSLFRQLTDQALNEVAGVLATRTIKPGDILFNMGDPGEELIIVKSGQLAIYAPQKDRPADGQAIRLFQAGDVLGDMALIDNKPRSLSARAEEESVIWVLAKNDFTNLLREHPEMGLAVMSGLSDRIRYTTDFLTQVRQWVQHVANGKYSSEEFTQNKDAYTDENLTRLAAEFANMAARVQEREELLKQEVQQLRIQIDESKRKEDVQEIVGSDYYKDLRTRVQQMREENKDE